MQKPKAKGTKRNRLQPLSTITNTMYTHHIDCFSIPSIESPKAKQDHTTLPLNASREPGSCFVGLPFERPNRTRLPNFGGSPSSDKMDVDNIDEKQAEAVTEAITTALFTQDFEVPDRQISAHVSDSSNDNQLKSFNEDKIVPGADTPMLIINIGTIQGVKHQRPLRALVDSGSKRSFIYSSVIPKEAQPTMLATGINTKMLDPSTVINSQVSHIT
jgi:hypothetical protein